MIKTAARRIGATGVLLSRGIVVHRWLTQLWMTPLIFLVGCDSPPEPIKSYTATDANRHEIRLLAAILSTGNDKAFVFKLSGPKAEVDPRREEFLSVVESFAKRERPRKLPVDWTEHEGKGSLRLLWYYIPGKTYPLECTLSLLEGEQATSIGGNLDRWRRQLSLPPLTEDDFERVIRFKRIDMLDIALVELSGYADYTPPAKPAPEAPPAAPDLPFKYDLPKEWVIVPPKPATLATLQVDASTELTISRLGGAAGGVEANVNRWRGQIGLPPVDGAEARKAATPFSAPIADMALVDLHNPAKGDVNRILVSLFVLGDSTWFIKMMGPSDEVLNNKNALQEFLRSFK